MEEDSRELGQSGHNLLISATPTLPKTAAAQDIAAADSSESRIVEHASAELEGPKTELGQGRSHKSKKASPSPVS